MKNAVFNKFYSYLLGMVAVLSCVFFMPTFAHAEEINFPVVPDWHIDEFTPEECISYFNSLGYAETTTTQYVIVLNGSNSYYYFLDVYATRLPMEDGTFGDGRPLSITSRTDPYFIELGSYTTDREFRWDKQDNKFVGDTTTDKYFSNANQILYCSSRSVYFKGSEDVAIQFTVEEEEPGSNLQGHPVPPNFDDDTVVPNVPEDNSFTAAQLLSKILNSLNGFKNIVKSGFQNVYDNFSNFFSPYLESFKNGIESLVSGVTTFKDSVLDKVSEFKDSVTSFQNKVSSIVDDFLDLGTYNGSFSILNVIRRLIIPDDLSVFKDNWLSLLDTLEYTYGTEILNYINQLKNLYNASTTNLVPEFIVPAFTIGGAQIPETVISFAIFVPFMPYLHSVMSAFMWLAFILFIIKDFPNFLSGFFSTADHEISAEHNVEYYRNHGGF